MSLPNQLSVLRIILTPVFLFLFLSGKTDYIRLSIIVFLIAVLTDWYDGWHARKFGLISAFGIFIDPLADKILTTAAFYCFYVIGIMPLWMVIVIALRDIIITLLRSYREIKGDTMKTTFIAKTKTFMQMTYIFLILSLIFAMTFNISDPFRNAISDFLISDINYYLILSITLITLYTGIAYLFELNKRNK
ncbi:MAG TPA: CDP-diacylglycerol--glycerol-3-phosphate 3-phosphatidyltransferase [Ignavibacteria bacterium]|nr:CDP-diacylglycerol--glycerol-3-phosphate 3-phosphatidyltransferase [Ignavibacteria bacterium]